MAQFLEGGSGIHVAFCENGTWNCVAYSLTNHLEQPWPRAWPALSKAMRACVPV